MADDYAGQAKITAGEINALPLLNTINCVVGTTVTKLTRPDGKTVLVLHAKSGDWNIRSGDFVSSGMPAAYLETGSLTNGSASLGVAENEKVVIQAPAEVTVRGYGATSVLAYYWL